MPASVADMSDARSTVLAWWCLSMTARSVTGLSVAAMANVTTACVPGGMLNVTPSTDTGSSPVTSVQAVVGAGCNCACGPLGAWLWPSQAWRSVCSCSRVTSPSVAAMK